MSKSIIVPIVAVIAFFIQSVFHVQISSDLQSQIIDFIVNAGLLVISLIGVFKNHQAVK